MDPNLKKETRKQKTKRINDDILRSQTFLNKEVQSLEKLKKDGVIFPKLLNTKDKANLTQKNLDKEFRKQSISFHPDRPPKIDKLQKYSEIVGDNKMVKDISTSETEEYQQQAFNKLTEAKEGLLQIPTKIATTNKNITQLKNRINTLKTEQQKVSEKKTLRENVFEFVKSAYQGAKSKASETKESVKNNAKSAYQGTKNNTIKWIKN